MNLRGEGNFAHLVIIKVLISFADYKLGEEFHKLLFNIVTQEHDTFTWTEEGKLLSIYFPYKANKYRDLQSIPEGSLLKKISLNT